MFESCKQELLNSDKIFYSLSSAIFFLLFLHVFDIIRYKIKKYMVFIKFTNSQFALIVFYTAISYFSSKTSYPAEKLAWRAH